MRGLALLVVIATAATAAVLAPPQRDSRAVPPMIRLTYHVSTGLAASSDVLEVRSTLAGVVQEDRLVKVGDQVEDAQPLVYVRTPLTGTIAVAARAPQDGVIRQVLVQPGQRVERGEIVVHLQPR